MRIDHAIDKAKYYIGQAIPFIKRVCIDYSRTHRIWRKKRTNGKYKYTVVSAVYNVEKYLDDYFKSFIEQTLDFKTHIWIILVDDGSTDSSASIIKKWQKLYPDNITYLYKENGGQGSARNVGIPLVKTPWVTFIDPDDFVDVTYFSHVDNFLKKHHVEGEPDKEVKMLACNLILYYEHNKRFFNRHPLKFKFKAKESIFKIHELNNFIQLSAPAAFFPTNELKKLNILFDERRWPSFEDAHFILRYLDNQEIGSVAFLRYPRYYYRKRCTLNSSVDLSRLKKELYVQQAQEAYLELLHNTYKKRNAIPYFIQQTILYDLSWGIKSFVNNPPPPCLNEDEVEIYFNTLIEIFKYIDRPLIENFNYNINKFGWELVVGSIVSFKKSSPSYQRVYIAEYNATKNLLCLVYYGDGQEAEEIYINDVRQEVLFAKNTQMSFMGKPFCLSRQLWIHLPSFFASLRVSIGQFNTVLDLNGRQMACISSSVINREFCKYSTTKTSKKSYKNSWIFMDRDICADDNAEHLYRYIKNNYPNQQIFFALRKNSSDWKRLKEEGFNLLEFGSPKHEQVLLECSKIISSNADHYITNYFKDLLKHKQFVFLQHGITIDNISRWLNNKKIDLLITTTQSEYDFFVKDKSPFLIPKQNVILSGMPRYDALVPFVGKHKRNILIMPTWRQYLVGNDVGKGNKRTLNPDFMQSKYAMAWQSVLLSPALKELSIKYDCTISFSPHINIQPYLSQFTIPDHIVVQNSKESIQNLFKDAIVLINDFSSVVFEFAFLKKVVLYYQFDRDEIYSGKHPGMKGYFDDTRDGFGPVVTQEDMLFIELEKILKNDGKPAPEYLGRMENTFPFKDGKNCERVYKSIVDLDYRHKSHDEYSLVKNA